MISWLIAIGIIYGLGALANRLHRRQRRHIPPPPANPPRPWATGKRDDRN